MTQVKNHSPKTRRPRGLWIVPLALGLLVLVLALLALNRFYLSRLPAHDPGAAIEKFAADHGLSPSDYPESICALLERNPEAADFVLHYPLEYGKTPEIDGEAFEKEFQDLSHVPLFLQWDRRWGYLDYGDDVAGLTACGPLCLSMAGYYLTQGEERFRPDRVIEFALGKGYCVPGHGSAWTLISQGGRELGLEVEELPLHRETIAENLSMGWPVICIMGPGVFTTGGHFIVLTGMEDGLFRVNDPNSPEKSQRLWDYDEFSDQVQNLWVLR